jgi:hypothetical protein
VEACVGVAVDQVPGRGREGVEGGSFFSAKGPSGALGVEGADEGDDGAFALVLHVSIALGVRREHLRAGGVDVVLPRLVEIGQDDDRVRVARPETRAQGTKKVVATGRTVKGRVRHHHDLEGPITGCEGLVHRAAEMDTPVITPGEPRARKRKRIDEGDRAPSGPEHPRTLHGSKVGEIGIVNEVPSDGEGGMDDQRAETFHGALESVLR